MYDGERPANNYISNIMCQGGYEVHIQRLLPGMQRRQYTGSVTYRPMGPVYNKKSFTSWAAKVDNLDG